MSDDSDRLRQALEVLAKLEWAYGFGFVTDRQQFRQRDRNRKMIALTLSDEARERLREFAERWQIPISQAVERLITSSRLPRETPNC